MEDTARPSRMRKIFTEMENSEINIQSYYEQLEKQFGAYCPFSQFKSILESFYPQIDKTDIIHFLSKVHLNSSGNVNLTLLFNAIAKYLNKEILSLKLVFYNIAYILGKKMKITTKEFFYKLGYQMQTELNVNDFITKVIPEFKLSEYVGITIFKSIDIKNKGIIIVQDIVTVIDSYRSDSIYKKGENINIYNNSGLNYGNINIKENDLYWINKLSKKILDENATITPKMLFDISKINNEDKMSLDIFKRKLNTLVFKKECKADELNLMINAIDINKNNKLTFEEFNDLIMLPKKQGNLNNIKSNENKISQSNQDIISELPIKSNYSTFNKFKFKTEEMQSGDNKLPTLNDIIDMKGEKIDINIIPENAGYANNLNENNNKKEMPINNISSGYQPIMGKEKDSQGNLPTLNALMTDKLSKEIIYNNNNNAGKPEENNIENNINKDNNIDNIEVDIPKKDPDNNLIINDQLTLNLQKTNTTSNKPTLSFLKKIENQDPKLQEFIKELDVFECGEWSLIDLLEDFSPEVEKEFFPIQDLFLILKEKFYPTISLSKIKTCIDNIDKDKDGYFSYLDLINFLNDNFNYGSTKLGWKLIASKIVSTLKQSPEDFFNKQFPKKSKYDNSSNYQSEINFIQFTKLLISHFKIKPTIAKQMYDDLQKLVYNHQITKGDLIDAVNRQLELNKSDFNSQKNNYKNISDIKFIYLNKENELKNKDTGISLLDQNYFEDQMKKLVSLLQKAFLVPESDNPKKTFVQNLSDFLRLPEYMTLYQFRNLFINQLQIDLSLGISLFQILKSYNKKNEKEKILPTVSKQDLCNILTSYMNLNINIFEPKLFLFYLENANYTSLKYCFESLEFHKNGVTDDELQKQLELFYPNIPLYIVKLIVKDIDEEKKGIISYKDLNNYLNKAMTKEENKFSENLILKYCASILDNQNIMTEKYLKKNLGIKNNNKGNQELLVQENEHNKYFSEVCGLNYVDCRKLWTFLAVTKNNKNYDLMRLTKLINFYRIEKN